MGEWKKVKIGQFLKEREGRYDPCDEAVLGLKRLNKIDFSGEIHLSDKSSKTDMIIVEPGDLVISGINVSKGALAVYYGEEPITATIHYSSYVFDERQIDIDYFKRFVRSQSFVQALKDQVKGGIKTEIKPKHFLPLEIHLPDIESQREIVSFFKRIENEMDDLSGEITHQQSFLKQLRQRILQEAIEGKLTAKWRKQHPDLITGDNHASKLLERIKAEKECLTKLTKSTKKKKALPPISEDEKPFDLPEGWVWCRLGELCNGIFTGPFGSMLHKSDYVQNGIPIVNPTHIINGQIITDGRMCVPERTKERLKRYSLTYGDLVIARRGDLSKCAVVQHEQDGWLCGTGSFFVRCLGVNRNFICLAYTSQKAQTYLLQDSIGQTMDNLNQKLLRKLPIGLPPLTEQQAIVKRVDMLMSMVDELEKQVSERKEQSEMLMQSVLREAFAKG
ncbi:MAG: restriction endonuclease subunit S [Planctomycetia bacterium]|uniref:restriction endonuclease subunit S n=1 Tax=Candidatus Kuenenia sp. TaxID=2499824 RepID=UPI001DFCDABB|nr:restriction endonuclease subunit S [Planctomycetia bacterium]